MATQYLVGGKKRFKDMQAALDYRNRIFARTGVIVAVQELGAGRRYWYEIEDEATGHWDLCGHCGDYLLDNRFDPNFCEYVQHKTYGPNDTCDRCHLPINQANRFA